MLHLIEFYSQCLRNVQLFSVMVIENSVKSVMPQKATLQRAIGIGSLSEISAECTIQNNTLQDVN